MSYEKDVNRIANAIEELVELQKLAVLSTYYEALLQERYATNRAYGPERATYESIDRAYGDKRLGAWCEKYAGASAKPPESDESSQSG